MPPPAPYETMRAILSLSSHAPTALARARRSAFAKARTSASS